MAAWLLLIVGSRLGFGERAPVWFLVAAGSVGSVAHATAIAVDQPLARTARDVATVPLLYLRELAPVLLPLFVVLAFMSRGLSLGAQIALGPLLLTLTWMIVRSELRPTFEVGRKLPTVLRLPSQTRQWR